MPKGDRQQFTFRPPHDHLDHYRDLAAREGIPLGDYLALRLAQAHGLPEPAYLTRNTDQLTIEAS